MTDRDVVGALRWHLGPSATRAALELGPIVFSRIARGERSIPADLSARIRRLALDEGIVDPDGGVVCRFCTLRVPLRHGWDVAHGALEAHEALEHLPPPVDVVFNDPVRARLVIALARDYVRLPRHDHQARRRCTRALRAALCGTT